MRWRRTFCVLHRDVGYLCIGLTLAYGISGIAVNHRRDWDYNYVSERLVYQVGSPAELLAELAGDYPQDVATDPDQLARRAQDQLTARLVATLGRNDDPVRVFWRAPDRLALIFATGQTDEVDYLPRKGLAEHVKRRPRLLLRSLNLLHLNEPGHLWTYIADAYAVSLVFLAVSGAVIVKGRKGLLGRGGLLALLGFAVVAGGWVWTFFV